MKKRVQGIDLIKVWGIVSVIGLHHLVPINFYNTVYSGSGSMYVLPIFQIIFLSCVPLFIASTGFLLSNRGVDKRHFTGIIYFWIEVVLIYSFGFLFYDLLIGKNELIVSLKELVKTILAPNYYIGLYTTLYFFSPFLNKLFYALSDKEKNILIIILITFISLIKIQNLIPHFVYYSGWPGGSYPILYYFVGLYIAYFRPQVSKVKLAVTVSVISLVYTIFSNFIFSERTFYYILGHYEGVFTLIMTILIFLLLYDLKVSSKLLSKLLTFLSNSTLSIYLMSTLFTDDLAMNFISLSTKLSGNIITIFSKILISLTFTLPIAIVLSLVNKFVIPRFKKRVNHKVA